jgi:hypothetical protein
MTYVLKAARAAGAACLATLVSTSFLRPQGPSGPQVWQRLFLYLLISLLFQNSFIEAMKGNKRCQTCGPGGPCGLNAGVQGEKKERLKPAPTRQNGLLPFLK